MSRSRLYPPSVDSGFPTLPATPKGWTRTTFDKVLEVVERPVKLDTSRVYKTLTAKRNRGGIVLRDEILGKDILTKTQFEVKAGDFVISRRQIIHGACAVAPTDLDGAVVSNEYSTLRPRDGLLMEFLEHYSHTPYFQRTCFHSSHGVDVEKMIFKIDEWLTRDTDIPPIGEQRKIAAILSAVDEAIEATQTVIDQLQVMKRAMMAELLTRGLPHRHTQFKQTEIGELPQGWEVLPFEAVLSNPDGDSLSYGILQPGEDVESGIPMLRTVDLDEHGGRADTTLLRVAREIEARYERTRLRGGEVLLSVMGTVGRTAVVSKEWEGWNVNRALAVIRVNQRVTPDFLSFWFRSPSTQDRFATEKIGSAQKRVNLGDLRKMLMPIPSLDEQSQLCDVMFAIDEYWRSEMKSLAAMQVAKAALMSVLLTGERRVTTDDVGSP